MLDARGCSAAVFGARIVVVERRRDADLTHAIRAGFAAVAGIGVAANATVCHGLVLDARGGVAAVGGAGVAVVEVRGGSVDARTGAVAGAVAVAGVAVVAAGASGRRGVGYAAERIASLDGAGVAVIARAGRARAALTGAITGLGAVALVGVGAAGAGRQWRVDGAGRGQATIGRAGVVVVEVERHAIAANTRSIAGFGAVAGILIGAAGSGRHRGVAHPERCIAAVERTRIVVGERRRCARQTLSLPTARLAAVARVAVFAAGAGRCCRVIDDSFGVDAVEGAGVAVVDVSRPANATLVAVVVVVVVLVVSVSSVVVRVVIVGGAVVTLRTVIVALALFEVVVGVAIARCRRLGFWLRQR
jgi:hypothetical protein